MSSRLGRGKQKDLLDGIVKTPAQLAQELAILLETEAQHLGDGDDVLADEDLAQNLLVDVLGKEQGALLMARRAEASSLATIRQQKIFTAQRAPQAGKTTAEVTASQVLFDDVPDDRAQMSFRIGWSGFDQRKNIRQSRQINRGVPGIPQPKDRPAGGCF